MGEVESSSSSVHLRVGYIWSEQLQHAADQLPSNLGRSSMVHELIKNLKLVSDNEDHATHLQQNGQTSPRAYITPPDSEIDAEAWMRRYHDARYVDSLLNPTTATRSDDESESSTSSRSSSSPRQKKRRRKTHHGLEHDCPPFPELPQYSTLVASSTLTACKLLIDGQADIAINWDGGRHHAMRNRASGFCYVADLVLGIMLLTKEGKGQHGKRPRVLYLDLDLHYGDGVAQAFLSPTRYPAEMSDKKPPRPPQVLTLSIHHHSPIFFPPHTPHSGLPDRDTPNPFTLSIPLAAYPSAQTYRRVWDNVEKVKTAFDPDYVMLQLGVDGLPGDRVGQYGAWGVEGEGGLRWCVQQVKSWGKPLCVLGGGGYDHANAARAWAVATAELAGKDLPVDTDIPDHSSYLEYAPSFTLEIPPSNVRDENTAESLQDIDEVFDGISMRIQQIVQSHGHQVT